LYIQEDSGLQVNLAASLRDKFTRFFKAKYAQLQANNTLINNLSSIVARGVGSVMNNNLNITQPPLTINLNNITNSTIVCSTKPNANNSIKDEQGVGKLFATINAHNNIESRDDSETPLSNAMSPSSINQENQLVNIKMDNNNNDAIIAVNSHPHTNAASNEISNFESSVNIDMEAPKQVQSTQIIRNNTNNKIHCKMNANLIPSTLLDIKQIDVLSGDYLYSILYEAKLEIIELHLIIFLLLLWLLLILLLLLLLLLLALPQFYLHQYPPHQC
jgi:hypothetical protein